MARTKKELKDQDTLLAGEAAEQAAEADASGTGLVSGGESGTPSPFDLELADGTPLDPNAPRLRQIRSREADSRPILTWNPAWSRLARVYRPLSSRLTWNLPETGRLYLAELQNRPRLTWNLRKALKARRTKALAPRLALNRRVMRLRMSLELPPPRRTPGSPKTGSKCLAGVASAWFPSTLSARLRRIRTSCAATCWTWWSP